MTFARHGLGGEAVRAADRPDIRDTCASSSHFLLAQKITEYRDTAPLKLCDSLVLSTVLRRWSPASSSFTINFFFFWLRNAYKYRLCCMSSLAALPFIMHILFIVTHTHTHTHTHTCANACTHTHTHRDHETCLPAAGNRQQFALC